MRRKKIFISVLILSIAGLITAFGIGKSSPEKLAGVKSDMVDATDQPVQFDDLKGKVVFVNNWASWCPPCIAEMPSIQQLKNKLNDQEIVFVMVSFDEDKEKAIAFMKRKGYDFDVYFPGENYPYATSSIPATFIIDKSGKVTSAYTGMADYNDNDLVSKLNKLANENSAGN